MLRRSMDAFCNMSRANDDLFDVSDCPTETSVRVTATFAVRNVGLGQGMIPMTMLLLCAEIRRWFMRGNAAAVSRRRPYDMATLLLEIQHATLEHRRLGKRRRL
jgi:hypothetical protein